jgi:uncharacterized protein YjiS (DUF1127 family)
MEKEGPMSTLVDLLGLRRPAGRPGATLARWLQVSRERRALAALDADARSDLGLTESAAAREAARPFWNLPAGR